MIPTLARIGAVFACFASLALAAPFVPDRDDLMLERLPEHGNAVAASLKPMREALRARPSDLSRASTFARAAIELSRRQGDPRWLGQATAALAPWWAMPDPPAEALLLRATIRQSLHQFEPALADLDRLLSRDPGDVQARLTRATVLGVVGRYRDAIADCGRLGPQVDRAVVIVCRAGPQSLSGEATVAYAALVEALSAPTRMAPAIEAWGWTVAGEIAARRGEADAAELAFRRALRADATDPYLLGAYADLLLDIGRPRDVVALLAPHARHDGLLLRLSIAASSLPEEDARRGAWRAELDARITAARQRGDGVHRREEARYALRIEGDADRALSLAQANFAVQKEAADLRMLAEAAIAASRPDAIRLVDRWIAANRIDDASIARVLGRQR
jgi:tetratricopeptide (TPR) repeat protein